MQTDTTEPVLLTPARAARKIGVSRSTLFRMRAEGKIHATRTPGGHHRYSPAEVDRVIAEMSA